MRKLVFLLVLLATMGIGAKADNVTFKASAPEAVVMGEQFQLTYTVNAEGKDFRAPELSGDFDVLMGPTMSTFYSSQMGTGGIHSETSTTYTFVLMPKKEGTFTVAPATVKVKGANYTSNGLAIKVLPPDKARTNSSQEGGESSGKIAKDGVFVKMFVSDTHVYEQEGFLVTFKIFCLPEYGLNVPGLKYPEFDGFLVQEIELPPTKQLVMDNYNGRNYLTAVMRQVVLYPQRSGKITIPSGRFDAVLQVRTQRKVHSIFDDDFFGSIQEYNKVLTTAPATIDVKPLPPGKPASFSGAVGNFTMTSSISANEVKADEAVTVKVKISGSGNVKLIKNPEVVFPNDFDVYDPKTETETKTTTAGVSGSKTIEYMAIPRYAGDFEIPAIAFSYFDPKTATYKTITSEPYKLHVEKGAGASTSGPVVSNFTNRESVKYLGQDIRYLKMKDISFVANNDIFFGSFMYFLCYLIPAILFIVFFIVYRKQVKENSDLALVRTKKANKMAVRRLKNAGKLLKENKKEEFYDEVLRASWGYLSDKLNIPQASLTKDNIEAELSRYGVDQALTDEFMEILNTCEFARYAPAQGSDAMDKLYKLTVDAISQMENTIKK